MHHKSSGKNDLMMLLYKMATKTSQEATDLVMRLGSVIDEAKECVVKAFEILQNGQPEKDCDEEEKDVFLSYFVICMTSKAFIQSCQKERDSSLFEQAKRIIIEQRGHPRKDDWSNVRCFFGKCIMFCSIQCLKEKAFNEVIALLQMFLEIHENDQVNGHEDTSEVERALRLIVTAHLESNNISAAVSACSLLEEANRNKKKESINCSTLLVLARVKAIQSNWVVAEELFGRVLQCSDLSAASGIAACLVFAQSGNNTLCNICFQKLMTHYRKTDQGEYEKVVLNWTEWVVEQSHSAQGKQSLGDSLKMISDIVNQGNPTEFSQGARKELTNLVWNEGSLALKTGDMTLASLWFQCALTLLEFVEDKQENCAKCWRLISHCDLCISHFEQAYEAAEHSLEYEPYSLCGLALLFQSALRGKLPGKEGDSVQAVLLRTLQRMQESAKTMNSKDIQPFFELCAQCAYEVNDEDLVLSCLETLMNISTGERLCPVLRCLLKTCLQREDRIKLSAKYLSVGVEKLKSVGPSLFFSAGSMMKDQIIESTSVPVQLEKDELQWLFSFAWSTAQDALKECQVESAVTLFSCAKQLSEFFQEDNAEVSNTKFIASILSASSKLELAQLPSTTPEDQTMLANQVASELDKFISSDTRQQSCGVSIFVDVLRFKAMAILRQTPAMEEMINRFLSSTSGNLPSGLLETLAEIAQPICPEHAAQCLKAAMTSAVKKGQKDFDIQRVCSLAHRLAKCSGKGDFMLENFKSILTVVNPLSSVWPAVSVQWFEATAWNKGVMMYRATDYFNAERWMSLALAFTKLRSNADPRDVAAMKSAYNKVLEAKISHPN